MNYSYDKTNPINHPPFQQIFNLEDLNQQNIKLKKVKISNDCIVENTTINFSGWIKYGLNNEEYNIREYKSSNICSFYMIKDIINNKLNKELEIYDIKKKLVELMMKEINKGWNTKIMLGKIFKAAGKKSLYKEILVANWENIIMNENYYITEYELYLLCIEYKINLICLSSKGGVSFKLPISQSNYFSTIQNDDDVYVLIIKNYKNVNKSYNFALITDKNNNINLNQNNLYKLIDYVGKIKPIDEFYNDFLKKYDSEQIKKKKDRASYMKNYRIKKIKNKKVELS